MRLEGENASPKAARSSRRKYRFRWCTTCGQHVVMMATPADLEDFAIGFTLTEGIVESIAEITRVDVVRARPGHRSASGHCGHLRRSAQVAGAFADRAHRMRTLRGRIDPGRSCATCNPVNPGGPPISPVMRSGHAEARAATGLQVWNQRDRLACTPRSGSHLRRIPEVVREDVGRHNALDKVIGALARIGPQSGRWLHGAHQPRELRAGAEGRRRAASGCSPPCRGRPDSRSGSPRRAGSPSWHCSGGGRRTCIRMVRGWGPRA